MRKLFVLIAFCCLFSSSSKAIYFPPVTGTTWDTVSLSSLGWCQDKMDTLIDYLSRHNTKAFILLKDGKIVTEHYYGTFTVDSAWQWNSAGKSLAAFLAGLAQEQGYININDSLPKYLQHGFSSCTTAAENAIHVRHQLTMTTGFDDGGTDNHCTDPACLVCIASPGTRWAYHNAPYTLLHRVIDSGTHIPFNLFTRNNLLNTCGITGAWINNIPSSPYDEIYFSKARSMARFGLLILNKGKWDNTTILHDTAYFNQMLGSSQNINPSYGYLWWLNGKSSYRLPSTQFTFNGPIVPHAPADMVAALGKNDQILNIVPSKGLVLVRMGDAFGTSVEVSNAVDDSIWVRLNDVFCNNTTSVSAITGSSPSLQIFPNPVASTFTVSVHSLSGPVALSIAGIDGKMILQQTIDPLHETTIDASKLVPGVYIISVRGSSGICRAQMVKQ